MKILSFDIEDWYHILDNSETRTETDWIKYPSRIHTSVDLILSMLDKSETKATFFILGWIGRKYPEIVRKISDHGYDIGTHSDMHCIAYEQNRQAFKSDLDRSIKTLQDITGKSVISYRAPGFSIKDLNKWAFEVLIESGIEIDCSIFPANRAHGGFREFGIAEPCLINTKVGTIKAFPMNLKSIGSFKFIFSGGGYFRFFPYALLRRWVNTEYVMTYFHPRDFDPDQPRIPGLSPWRVFKSYYGLKQTQYKLTRILHDYNFIDLKTAAGLVDWESVPTKNL